MDFAVRSRLPVSYLDGEFADAGGLHQNGPTGWMLPIGHGRNSQ
jgi:hypothetical protein